MNEREIFIAARQRQDAADRDGFLDKACAGDQELRRRIVALLEEQAQLGSFMEHDNPPAATIDKLHQERPGVVIGSYKLLEQIGEGGMGTVWMAQQVEPVKRVVALKLIKAGMDSKQVIARFEAERQALALMDHPNIARVLDGGTTDAGRPYFVMDLVKGVPITKYCDEHHLTPRQRLELFVPVCQAVQHAHQKGIIHRDLKPSNVLVALYDGKPAPKVIDFGVAKAAGQQLTDKTLLTGLGNIVGTLEYMSPEQAEVNQLDIDTRSDIYSLGVLLYELLTGSPPFTRKELEKAGMLEMLRVIREEEPSKPSTKLSTAQGLPTLAANRGTEPAKLTRLVRGELDWIVMKALEKDRSRRYETANGFAADLQRYLCDEPVQACPPSAGYRLRKFATRNKGPVLAVSLVVVALLAGLIGTTWGMVWAIDERDGKEQARQVAETNEQKAKSAATEARNAEGEARKAEGDARKAETEARTAEGKARTAEEKERKAREQAQARLTQMEKASWMLSTVLTEAALSTPENVGKPVKVYFAERLDYALTLLDVEAIDEPIIVAKIQSTFANCYHILDFQLKAIPLLEKAVKTQKAELGPGHRDTLQSMNSLCTCYRYVRRPTAAVPLEEEMLKVHQDKFGPDHKDTLYRMDMLAMSYKQAGRVAEAVTLVDEAARRRKPDDPRWEMAMHTRASVYQAAGRGAEAMALHEEIVQRRKDKFGPDHHETLVAMSNLGLNYRENREFDKAVSLFEQIIKVKKDRHGPDHVNTLFSMGNLALVYLAAGRRADALPLLTELVPKYRKKFGIQFESTQTAIRNLIACHEALGQPAQAEPLHREMVDFSRKSGPFSPVYANDLVSLGRNLLLFQRKPALAEPVLREYLTIRLKSAPDAWMTFEAKSLLGAALLDQKKYKDAEPLLLDGYRGLKEHAVKTPSIVPILEAMRLVRLYDALGNADEAAKWRKELDDIHKRIKLKKSGTKPIKP